MQRIKSNDEVIVIAGKSKGHVGKVLKVAADKVLVEGANLIKKHVKPSQKGQEMNKGGIVTCEAFVHVSNVAHYNPATKKADKIGFKFIDKENRKIKVRYYKSNNEIIDRV